MTCLVLASAVHLLWLSTEPEKQRTGCLFQARLCRQQTWLPFPALPQMACMTLSEFGSFSSTLCVVREGVLVCP